MLFPNAAGSANSDLHFDILRQRSKLTEPKIEVDKRQAGRLFPGIIVTVQCVPCGLES